MSRDFEFDDRDFEERKPDAEDQSRMPLSQGRGGGSGGEEHRRKKPDEPVLAALRALIDEAAQGHPTVSEFLDRLEERGVHPVASVQSSGRWNGIVYQFANSRVKGSHLGRAYTAKGLQERRGIRYERVRDDERLARTSPSAERSLRIQPDLRDPEIDTANRGDRLRDVSEITPAERTVLWDVGRFRTIQVADLQRVRYSQDKAQLQRDLNHLAGKRYQERLIVPVDSRGRTIEVLALTRRGKSFLKRTSPGTGRPAADAGQAIYSGFVKPREIVHDAALYRMYQAEKSRIERNGGKVRRVVLDYELKKRAYSALAKTYDLPPLEYAERQREIAGDNDLPVIDGHITLPDLRIEYQTPDGEDRHIDLELATRNYRAAHIRSKAAAGFRVYADTGSHALAAVLDDHDVIAELLRM